MNNLDVTEQPETPARVAWSAWLGGSPPAPGRYLVLVYDWCGMPTEKPKQPDWQIRPWSGTHWVRPRYTFDTGGMENFEVVGWLPLPPNDQAQR